MGNISCEFQISTYSTLCSTGPTKVLAESRKNARGSHLVFQNEAKNIPRQDFMVMNISFKFEKGTYNIFSLSLKISPKRPKMDSVRYFGGLWMTFNEELQGQISACLQDIYMYYIYQPKDDLTFCI